MTITFILNDEAVNDQTTGLQTGDSGDGFIDTDVAYSSLSASFRTYLETTLGLNPTFPTSVGVATKTNSVTVNASTGSLTDIRFTDGSGGALDGDDSGLDTVDGRSILLFADGDDIVIGRYDSDGNGSADAVAFVIFKEEVLNAGATSAQVAFHVVTYAPIFHGDSTDPDDAVNLGNTLKLTASEKIGFSFAGTPSGNHLFTMVASGGTGLVATPEAEVIKLHISQGGGPTTLGVFNQMIDPGETMVFTFVTSPNTNFTVPNLSQGEADAETNILFGGLNTSTGGSVEISQTQGNDPAGFRLTALNTQGDGSATEPSGDGFINGYANDPIAAISEVRVFNASGTLLLTATGDVTTPVNGITVDFLASGEVELRGLQDDYTVEYDAASHERLKVTGVQGKFDIGGIGVETAGTQSAFVGQQIVIEDDGPTAAIVQGAPVVAHDETAGVQADANDTTAAGVVALFAGVANVSADLSPTGYAQNASPVVSSTGSSFGTDLGGTTAFSLAVSAAGVDSGLDTTNGTSIFLFKEGNLVVGRIGGAAGQAAFAVAINSTTGVVSVAQYASLRHPNTTNPDDSVSITDSALQAVVTVTDRDGDTATALTGIGDAVQFQDDGPTAAIVQGAPVVAHDETAGVQADADDTTAAGVVALFAGVANVSTDLSPTGYAQDASPVVSSTGSSFGADQEGATTAFSLAVSAAGVDSGLDTTNGTSIFLFKEGNLVVGRIGGAAGQAAFAVAINSTTGVVSVAQYASLLHPNATNPDDTVSITDSALQAVVTVTDGDGDIATASTGIGDAVQFQDDGPAIGPISDGLVDFAAGDSVTNPLNGVVGADNPATFSITSSPATLTILDGTSGQLTLLRDITGNGTTVTYFQDVDSSGTHTAGDIDFFRLSLSGGNYTFDVLHDPPAAELQFGFAGAPSGSNLFMIFGDTASAQIVVIGEDPLNQSQGGNINTKDVLNISQAGSTTSFGVNGNQINPDEGAFITYVTGTNTNFLVPNLDQNEADIEANIAFTGVFNATSASFTVNQTNPGKGPVTVKISAFNTAAEPGVNFVDGLTNDTQVNITSGSVVNFVVSGESTPVATVNADGTLTVTGLTSGDQVRWTTSGTHDRVLIQNISNADGIAGNDNNTFDIGGFGLVRSQPAPDEKLDFTVQIADADGDTANDSFSIGIDGTGLFDDNHVDGVIA
ncbi:DUF5801 repeats-in-toxin domain-containing protein [Inquilinus sp. OTU3971]|uniref:DUF5801 repeats-in-toxin domain-containing protein n=1 Tax=Inquilinus sp. OTU3971 TaxID=3043855 RepID=UPI00313C8CBC